MFVHISTWFLTVKVKLKLQMVFKKHSCVRMMKIKVFLRKKT